MNTADSPPDTAPRHDPPLAAGDYQEYLLRSRNEILYVLRLLKDGNDPVTLYFDDGRLWLPTVVVAADDDGLALDYSGNPSMNERALRAGHGHCVTSHDRVRIQFSLERIATGTSDGKPAFRAPLPSAVLRLQRREFYRLTTPAARPLKCRIPLSPTQEGRNSLEVSVIDISGGGMAIMVPPEGVAFEPGTEFAGCRIELPEVGVITATLNVRSVFAVTLRNGHQVWRSGCQFIDLPGPMLTLVQRYIIKVERERKARESGLE